MWPTQNLGDSIAIQKGFVRQQWLSTGGDPPLPRDIWLCLHTRLVVTTRGKVCHQQVLGRGQGPTKHKTVPHGREFSGPNRESCL